MPPCVWSRSPRGAVAEQHATFSVSDVSDLVGLCNRVITDKPEFCNGASRRWPMISSVTEYRRNRAVDGDEWIVTQPGYTQLSVAIALRDEIDQLAMPVLLTRDRPACRLALFPVAAQLSGRRIFLLAERGINVSHETARCRALKFGSTYARGFKVIHRSLCQPASRRRFSSRSAGSACARSASDAAVADEPPL